MQEVVTSVASNNTGTNRTLWQNIRAGVDGNTPVLSGTSDTSGTSSPDLIGISGTSISGNFTPSTSVISGTSIDPTWGISETSAIPPSGGLWSHIIGNIRQPTYLNFIMSDEFKAVIDRKLSNDPIVQPVSTQVFGAKLSNIYRRDIYTRCRLNLATDSVNLVEPQFVNNGISSANTLNKAI